MIDALLNHDTLLNHAPCGFVSFDDDGAMLAVNATLREMLGYESQEQLLGRHVEVLLSTGGRIFYQTHVFPLLKLQGKVEEIYLTLRRSDNNTIPVLAYARRRATAAGNHNDCVVVPVQQRNEFEDQILQAKRRAEDAVRAKQEFLAAVSHDLRTPLNAILGWAQMLRAGMLDAAEYPEAFEAIEASAKVQSQLIDDLLDMARITAGKLRLDVGDVDLVRVVQAAFDTVRPAAMAKNIALKADWPERAELKGDADRLQQVMWNLLSNAIKFTPDGGLVRVRIRCTADELQMDVTDTGRGISPEFLPFVFDRFSQAGDTGRGGGGGLGLGMAITRQIVELHGGTIAAHSEGDGKGATFTVKFPRAENAA